MTRFWAPAGTPSISNDPSSFVMAKKGWSKTMMNPFIQEWMSQFSGIGRRSATSLISTWPLGGRIWLNGALVKAEKRTLLAHAREGLGAHHSPDLFRVQHDLSKATGLALRARLSRAQADLDAAHQQTQRWIARRDASQQGPRRPGRP